MLNETIGASVGMHNNGTTNCYNLPNDVAAIIRLLNSVSFPNGGMAPTQLKPSASPRDLYEAILHFQRVQNDSGSMPQLSVDGHVDPGGNTLTRLNMLAGPQRQPLFTIRGADLQLLLQQTNTLGGFIHRSYFTKAESLLSDFGLGLNIIDRRSPEFEIPGGTFDPVNKSDIASVRLLAEKHTLGMTNVLRVIFCRFSQHGLRIFAITEGGVLEGGLRVPDFIVIDVGTRTADNCALIHEMIHATGLVTHDPDSASVFSLGSNRTDLKPEHAERLSKAFFAAIRH